MAGTALSKTAADAVLKELYPFGINEYVMQRYPALATLKKAHFKSSGGRHMVIPFAFSPGGGASNTFSDAQTESGAESYEAWNVTLVRLYGIKQIDGLAAAVMSKDDHAFIKGMKRVADSAFNAANLQLASQIFRRGDGDIGTINGVTTGTTITLLNKRDAVNFEVGYQIGGAAAPTTTYAVAMRNSGGVLAVTAVDRINGTLTAGSNWNTITGLVSTDRLIKRGNRAAAGTLVGISGFDKWIPEIVPGTNPEPAALFGVTRSSDPVRLGGIRFDASTGYSSRIAALMDAMTEAQLSMPIDRIYIHPDQWNAIAKEGEGTVVRNKGAVKGQLASGEEMGIGFTSLVLQGPYGNNVDIIADPWCQRDVAWLINSDTIYLIGAGGEVPHLDRSGGDDGTSYLRKNDADEYEIRVKAYCNVACTFPGANIRCKLWTSDLP